jgi:hypothetical protein
VITKAPRLGLAAALWSFAEATLFFVVVDVLLSFAAVARGWRAAARAALWSTLGALAGGLVLYLWATTDPLAAQAAVASVPGITPGMMVRVEEDFAQRGLTSLLLAGVTGVPYKIYAASAPQAGIGLAAFLLASAGARLGRFLLAVALAAAFDRMLAGWLGRSWRLGLLAGLWLVFYALYWSFFAGA